MPRPPRVAQVITGLNTGGAETMIMRLIERLDREAFESVVVSLTDVGTIGPRIAELGIDVVALGASGVPTPGDLRRIRAGIARLDLDLVQTWTLYGNVLGGIGARLAGSAPIVWGVHHSGDDLASLGTRVVLTQRFERRLAARLPTRIVACSQSSRRMLAAQRYPQEKVVTILNGFDVKRFHPDPAARGGGPRRARARPDRPGRRPRGALSRGQGPRPAARGREARRPRRARRALRPVRRRASSPATRRWRSSRRRSATGS